MSSCIDVQVHVKPFPMYTEVWTYGKSYRASGLSCTDVLMLMKPFSRYTEVGIKIIACGIFIIAYKVPIFWESLKSFWTFSTFAHRF